MFYYIGPWDIKGNKYQAPTGTIGTLDLRSVPEQSNLNGDGYGIFITETPLKNGYELFCTGDFREVKTDIRHLNIIESFIGYRPKGDSVSDLVFDIFLNGAHPDGLNGVKPILPNNTKLELCVGGHGKVRGKALDQNAREYNLIRDVIRQDYRKMRALGTNVHRKFLAILAKEYDIDNPEDEFIPSDLPKEKPLRPSTILTETWPTNGTTLTSGQDLEWDQNTGQVVSNQWNMGTISGTIYQAYAVDTLSQANLWTELDVITLDAPSSGSSEISNSIEVVARYNNTGPEYYGVVLRLRRNANLEYQIFKFVGGTRTDLTSDLTFTGTKLGKKRIEAIGGQIYYYDQGSNLINNLTDTSITGNTRGGFRSENDDNASLGDVIFDDIQIADEQFLGLNPIGVNQYLPLKGNNNKYSVWRVV